MRPNLLTVLVIAFAYGYGAYGQKPNDPTDELALDNLPRLDSIMIRDNKISGEELKKQQVYLANTLLLYRQLTEQGQARSKSGWLVNSLGKTYEFVLFNRFTPGVIEQTSWNDVSDSHVDEQLRLLVSFEPGCTLEFTGGALVSSDSPSYCGTKYKALPELSDSDKSDLAKLVRTGTQGMKIDNIWLSSRSSLFIRFKAAEPTGTVRVVPGRTVDKK